MASYRHDIEGAGFRVGYDISICLDITAGPESAWDLGKPRALYEEMEGFEAELHYDLFRAYHHATEEIRRRFAEWQASERLIADYMAGGAKRIEEGQT